jgi:putative phage-type endonuclease
MDVVKFRDKREWLEARTTAGIGGSEAAAVMGLSPWASPYDVYLVKRREAPPVEETGPMRWGNILQGPVIQEYASQTGRTARTFDNELVKDPKHEWMFASPDGIAGDRLIEAKTARTREGWGEPGTDQVPDGYVLQVQHLMVVTALPVADIPVLFGGSDFAIYTVQADPEIQQYVVDAEHDFWFDHVRRGIPPAAVTLEDARRRFKFARALEVQASDKIANVAEQLRAVRSEIDRLEKFEGEFKVALMNCMGEADTLKFGKAVLATWKEQKGAKKFDTAAFKAAHPDLYEQFTKEGEPFRRFLIKEIK